MKNRRLIRHITILIITISLSTTPALAAFSGGVEAFEYGELSIPAYDGDAYEVINDNDPTFTEAEKASRESYEVYSNFDGLGRVGVVMANIDYDSLPTEPRGSISHITPTGWIQQKYDIVSGGWLFNRSHLYGYQIGGDDLETNLMTGTRAFNVNGMLPIENQVANYVQNSEESGHHVLYRVTPIFDDENLLAKGVLMEAESLEDETINICVFCYNVQPGILMDYLTGASILENGDVAKDISSAKINSVGIKVFSGKFIKPGLVVKDGDKTLKAGADYNVTYTSNKLPGKAKATITVIGAYKGTKTVFFIIKPGKTVITSAKTKSRAVTLKWKKQSGITGYQIQYRKIGPNKYKTLNVKTAGRTFKKLKRGKNYQFKVRSYKVIGGKKYFGAFSKTKKVRVR